MSSNSWINPDVRVKSLFLQVFDDHDVTDAAATAAAACLLCRQNPGEIKTILDNMYKTINNVPAPGLVVTLKTFECDFCDMKFIDRRSLNCHLAAVHDGKNLFECNICGMILPLN